MELRRNRIDLNVETITTITPIKCDGFETFHEISFGAHQTVIVDGSDYWKIIKHID